MTLVVGVDSYRKGWVAVVLLEGVVERVAIFDSWADILEALPDADAIGIDIPIGMPTAGVRGADRGARRFVKPRTAVADADDS